MFSVWDAMKSLALSIAVMAVTALAPPAKVERIGVTIHTGVGYGHACPISPTLALTARHVIDPDPRNPNVQMVGGRYFGPKAEIRTFDPIITLRNVDVAVLLGRWDYHYRLSKKSAVVGETVYVAGFDWDDPSRLFRNKIYEAKVVALNGGMFSYDKPPGPGSSGSCVLNEAGEVIGIHTIGTLGMDGSPVGYGSGAGEATWAWTLEQIEAMVAEAMAKAKTSQ